MSQYHWYYDPDTGDLYYPDGSQATHLGDTPTPIYDAQVWAIGVVDQVGLSNLTNQQMMWLLAMNMGLVSYGPPPA